MLVCEAAARSRRRLRLELGASLRVELDMEEQVTTSSWIDWPSASNIDVALGPVLDERVLLGHRAQVDALPQVVHVLEVLAPAGVDHLEDDVALGSRMSGLPSSAGAELVLLLAYSSRASSANSWISFSRPTSSLLPSSRG